MRVITANNRNEITIPALQTRVKCKSSIKLMDDHDAGESDVPTHTHTLQTRAK